MDGISATVIARLGRDPELKFTAAAVPILKLWAVVLDSKAEERGEDPTWLSVACFGELAEGLADVLRKGSVVQLEGRLRLSRWRTREGEERTTLELSAWSATPLAGAGRGPRRPRGVAAVAS